MEVQRAKLKPFRGPPPPAQREIAGHLAESLTVSLTLKLCPQDQLAVDMVEKLPRPDLEVLQGFMQQFEAAAQQFDDELDNGVSNDDHSKHTLSCTLAETIYHALTVSKELLNAANSMPGVEGSVIPDLRDANNARAEARFLIESLFRKT